MRIRIRAECLQALYFEEYQVIIAEDEYDLSYSYCQVLFIDIFLLGGHSIIKIKEGSV